MACHKKTYETRLHAVNDARVVSRKRADERAEAYQCRACGKWHVGGRWNSLDYQPKGKRRDKRVIVPDDRD